MKKQSYSRINCYADFTYKARYGFLYQNTLLNQLRAILLEYGCYDYLSFVASLQLLHLLFGYRIQSILYVTLSDLVGDNF